MNQKIIPCIWFDSEAEEAARFYISIFKDSKINTIQKYVTEAPSNKPIGSVLLVEFELSNFKFMSLNGGSNFTPNPSISFHVKCSTVVEVNSIWDKLSDGGKILMPLDKYPFSERYGWVQDKYGVSWQIIHVDSEFSQKITPVLMFVGKNYGKTEEAIRLYTSIIEGSIISIQNFGKDEKPNNEGDVKYANFELEGQEFGALDSAHEHEFSFNEGISLIINCSDQEEIDYFYDNLSSSPEFEVCGWLKDKYGVSWQLNVPEFGKYLEKKEVMDALLDMDRLDLQKLKDTYDKS